LAGWWIPTTDQIFAMRDAAVVAGQQADELQTKSIVLGYNVGHTVAIEGGTNTGPEISFHVWRFDQKHRAEDGPSYASVAEVEAHLEQLAGLPRYCLDLVGNVHVRVVSEDDTAFTVITDTRTDQEFYVRTVDMEAIVVLPIHAEAAPTVGDWRLRAPGE
jgi:hypothetical protein